MSLPQYHLCSQLSLVSKQNQHFVLLNLFYITYIPRPYRPDPTLKFRRVVKLPVMYHNTQTCRIKPTLLPQSHHAMTVETKITFLNYNFAELPYTILINVCPSYLLTDKTTHQQKGQTCQHCLMKKTAQSISSIKWKSVAVNLSSFKQIKRECTVRLNGEFVWEFPAWVIYREFDASTPYVRYFSRRHFIVHCD